MTASWAAAPPTYLATGPTGTQRRASAARATCARPPPRSASCARRPGRPRSRSTPAPPTGALWDWKTASGGDGVGFLIDLTPTGQVRIITSGRGVTTNAVAADRALHQPRHHRRPRRQPRRLRRRRADRRRHAARPRHQRLRAGRAALRRRPGRRPAHQRRARPHRDVHQGAQRRPTARAGRRWRSSDGGQHAEPPIGGTVPQVLALSLGAARARTSARSLPGVTKDYTASLTATITTTAPNAALSVHDPSATATGHLVQGHLRDAAGAAGAGGPGVRAGRRRRRRC